MAAWLDGLVDSVIFPLAALLSLGSLGSHVNPRLEAVRSAEISAPTELQDWSGNPEAEALPEAGTHSPDQLVDAVRRLLPLRGGVS